MATKKQVPKSSQKQTTSKPSPASDRGKSTADDPPQTVAESTARSTVSGPAQKLRRVDIQDLATLKQTGAVMLLECSQILRITNPQGELGSDVIAFAKRKRHVGYRLAEHRFRNYYLFNHRV